jgi:hypothetical protein
VGNLCVAIYLHDQTQIWSPKESGGSLSLKTPLITSMKTKVLCFEFVKDALCTDLFFGLPLNNGVIENQSGYFLLDGFLFKGTQLCVLEGSLWLKIIQELHDEGHMGWDKMFKLVSD